MGILSAITGAVTGALRSNFNKYSGNKDFLEAVCAASALVAAADGEISDEEILAAVESVKNNPTLSGVYSTNEIETTLDVMLKRCKTMSGRAALMRELDDVALKDQDMRDDVYLAAADIAASDGTVEPAEKTVLTKIAGRLGVNPAKFEFA